MIDNGYTAQVIHCHPGAAGVTFTEFSHPRMETALEEWAALGLTTTAIRTELRRTFLGSQCAGLRVEIEPELTVGGHTVTAFIVHKRQRRTRRRLTLAEQNEITAWHQAGFDYREIAEAVGREPSTVGSYLRRVGLTGRAGA